MSRSSTLLASLIVGLALACSADPDVEREGGQVPSETGGTDQGAGGAMPAVSYCAALSIVQDKCQSCHADPPKHGAPVPFLSAADFHHPYGSSGTVEYWEVAIDQVESGTMPYVVLNNPPTSLMPPVEPLSATEKATLLGWLRQGATEEGGTDCP
ncbi:MAG TPA: hypothetical protein VEQ59_00035 [Polyangiaceae bacterium]|nr:hypothetical protein [Polyangiaceae bacterium]